jgi:hypothetical protein
VRGATVRAETEVIRGGRQIVFLESKVRATAGKLVAAATGSFMVMGTETTERVASGLCARAKHARSNTTPVVVNFGGS